MTIAAQIVTATVYLYLALLAGGVALSVLRSIFR